MQHNGDWYIPVEGKNWLFLLPNCKREIQTSYYEDPLHHEAKHRSAANLGSAARDRWSGNQPRTPQEASIVVSVRGHHGWHEERVRWLRDQVDHLTKENKKLSMKIAQLDEQNRNKNLVFYGYEEEDNETWEDCENKIKQTIEEEFECTVDDRDIEKVFRVGKKRGDSDSEEEEKKPRPIICKFSSLKIRSKVLSNARSITRDKRSKNEPIPKVKVSEDYSPEVRETRRKLTSILIEKKEEAQRKNNKDFKCSLRHDKLVINSTVYKLDESGTLCKI